MPAPRATTQLTQNPSCLTTHPTLTVFLHPCFARPSTTRNHRSTQLRPKQKSVAPRAQLEPGSHTCCIHAVRACTGVASVRPQINTAQTKTERSVALRAQLEPGSPAAALMLSACTGVASVVAWGRPAWFGGGSGHPGRALGTGAVLPGLHVWGILAGLELHGAPRGLLCHC